MFMVKIRGGGGGKGIHRMKFFFFRKCPRFLSRVIDLLNAIKLYILFSRGYLALAVANCFFTEISIYPSSVINVQKQPTS